MQGLPLKRAFFLFLIRKIGYEKNAGLSFTRWMQKVENILLRNNLSENKLKIE